MSADQMMKPQKHYFLINFEISYVYLFSNSPWFLKSTWIFVDFKNQGKFHSSFIYIVGYGLLILSLIYDVYVMILIKS